MQRFGIVNMKATIKVFILFIVVLCTISYVKSDVYVESKPINLTGYNSFNIFINETESGVSSMNYSFDTATIQYPNESMDPSVQPKSFKIKIPLDTVFADDSINVTNFSATLIGYSKAKIYRPSYFNKIYFNVSWVDPCTLSDSQLFGLEEDWLYSYMVNDSKVAGLNGIGNIYSWWKFEYNLATFKISDRTEEEKYDVYKITVNTNFTINNPFNVHICVYNFSSDSWIELLSTTSFDGNITIENVSGIVDNNTIKILLWFYPTVYSTVWINNLDVYIHSYPRNPGISIIYNGTPYTTTCGNWNFLDSELSYTTYNVLNPSNAEDEDWDTHSSISSVQYGYIIENYSFYDPFLGVFVFKYEVPSSTTEQINTSIYCYDWYNYGWVYLFSVTQEFDSISGTYLAIPPTTYSVTLSANCMKYGENISILINTTGTSSSTANYYEGALQVTPKFNLNGSCGDFGPLALDLIRNIVSDCINVGNVTDYFECEIPIYVSSFSNGIVGISDINITLNYTVRLFDKTSPTTYYQSPDVPYFAPDYDYYNGSVYDSYSYILPQYISNGKNKLIFNITGFYFDGPKCCVFESYLPPPACPGSISWSIPDSYVYTSDYGCYDVVGGVCPFNITISSLLCPESFFVSTNESKKLITTVNVTKNSTISGHNILHTYNKTINVTEDISNDFIYIEIPISVLDDWTSRNSGWDYLYIDGKGDKLDYISEYDYYTINDTVNMYQQGSNVIIQITPFFGSSSLEPGVHDIVLKYYTSGGGSGGGGSSSYTPPSTPPPPPPQPTCQDDPTLCATEEECLSAGWYWYDNSCHSQPSTIATCENDPSLCKTQDECLSAGWYWYGNACHFVQGTEESITVYPHQLNFHIYPEKLCDEKNVTITWLDSESQFVYSWVSPDIIKYVKYPTLDTKFVIEPHKPINLTIKVCGIEDEFNYISDVEKHMGDISFFIEKEGMRIQDTFLNIINIYREPPSKCVEDPKYCTTKEECEDAGWYWYDDSCHSEPKPVAPPAPPKPRGVPITYIIIGFIIVLAIYTLTHIFK